MNSLSRHKGFRCFVVIVLVAVLFGALLLHAGSNPALLVDLFVFLFLLIASNCPVREVIAAALPDIIGELQPARAPPTPSF